MRLLLPPSVTLLCATVGLLLCCCALRLVPGAAGTRSPAASPLLPTPHKLRLRLRPTAVVGSSQEEAADLLQQAMDTAQDIPSIQSNYDPEMRITGATIEESVEALGVLKLLPDVPASRQVRRQLLEVVCCGLGLEEDAEEDNELLSLKQVADLVALLAQSDEDCWALDQAITKVQSLLLSERLGGDGTKSVLDEGMCEIVAAFGLVAACGVHNCGPIAESFLNAALREGRTDLGWLNGGALASLIWGYASLCTSLDQLPLLAPIFGQVLAAASDLPDSELQGEDLATILRSCTLMDGAALGGYRAGPLAELFAAAVRRSGDILPDLADEDICSLGSALAIGATADAGVDIRRTAELANLLFAEVARRSLIGLSPREVAALGWSCAFLSRGSSSWGASGSVWPEEMGQDGDPLRSEQQDELEALFVAKICARYKERSENWEVDDAAQMLWALAVLAGGDAYWQPNRELLGCLRAVGSLAGALSGMLGMSERLQDLSAESLCDVVWSLARLKVGMAARVACETISQSMIDRLHEASPSQISKLGWAYAELGHACPELISRVARSVEARLDAFETSDLSRILPALGVLGHRVRRRSSWRLDPAALNIMNAKEVLALAWGLAKTAPNDDKAVTSIVGEEVRSAESGKDEGAEETESARVAAQEEEDRAAVLLPLVTHIGPQLLALSPRELCQWAWALLHMSGPEMVETSPEIGSATDTLLQECRKWISAMTASQLATVLQCACGLRRRCDELFWELSTEIDERAQALSDIPPTSASSREVFPPIGKCQWWVERYRRTFSPAPLPSPDQSEQ
jgi:hypothetical protein